MDRKPSVPRLSNLKTPKGGRNGSTKVDHPQDFQFGKTVITPKRERAKSAIGKGIKNVPQLLAKSLTTPLVVEVPKIPEHGNFDPWLAWDIANGINEDSFKYLLKQSNPPEEL